MRQYWTNFVRTGIPDTQGVPNWPRAAFGTDMARMLVAPASRDSLDTEFAKVLVGFKKPKKVLKGRSTCRQTHWHCAAYFSSS